MNFSKAKQTILYHAAGTPTATGDSLLSSLRPYRGLHEQHFLDIVQALVVVAPKLNAGKVVDRELVGALWGLCWIGKNWSRGLHDSARHEPLHHGKDRMSNGDKELLEDWLGLIEQMSLRLLWGRATTDVFGYMLDYVLNRQCGDRAAFLMDTFLEILRDRMREPGIASEDDEEKLCRIFESMGSTAAAATPLLLELLAKSRSDAVRIAANSAMKTIQAKGNANSD